ncbi:MAG: M6 family metalloprotease domain-containing protein [Chthonomonadales bacterium]|nr:M6 family metalloprotease domain-containing protein [Chthonomonadales bacterium]
MRNTFAPAGSRLRSRLLATSLVPLLTALATAPCGAVEPPRPGELARYRADGTLAQRQAYARSKGNYRFSPDLVQRKAAQMGQLRSMAPPGGGSLPSLGAPKTLLIAIDFPDYPHSVDASTLQSMMFGAGNQANFPIESLNRYYQRSSYGKLDIQGNVLGWYRAKNNRDTYTDKAETLIEEAMDYYAAQGHDFAQYDNDSDGRVDYFCVMWTGPDTGWGSFWWGWFGGFGDASYRVSGKSLGGFSWQWEQGDPTVIIHETGHALGLPDYYDYDDSVGPRGGVGSLDEMASNNCDHNGFSKWMLDWLVPATVGSLKEARDYVLRPTSTTTDAVAVMPGMTPAGLFSEWFLVQNRSRLANDTWMPTDGIIIWHVDARLNQYGWFAYDNSYTEHKLLRVMEADGLEEIEKGYGSNAGDFYVPGKVFSSTSTPNSSNYAGSKTLVLVGNVTGAPAAYTCRISAGGSPDLLVKLQSEPTAQYAGDDLYQAAPTGVQKRSEDITTGNSKAYSIRLQNDDVIARTFRLRATENAAPGWSAIYSDGVFDISAAMRSGSYITPSLAPGATLDLTVTLVAGASAVSRSSMSAIVTTGFDQSDTVARDAVEVAATVLVGVPGPPTIIAPTSGSPYASIPTFRLSAQDPDGHEVRFDVEITQRGTTRTYETPWVASGQECEYALPPDHGLTIGRIDWRVRTVCKLNALSDWVSAWFAYNRPPQPPSLLEPSAGGVVGPEPAFRLSATEPDGDGLRFRVILKRDGNVTATYDQSVSASGWDRASYGSGDVATYQVPPEGALATAEYTWEAQAYDGYYWTPISGPVPFRVDRAPGVPSLVAPTGGIKVTPRPSFVLRCVEPDGQAIRYRIRIYRDGVEVKTFDQTVAGGGWDQPEYASGATATFVPPADQALESGACTWTAEAFDGSVWGPASAASAFVVNVPPSAPTLGAPANGAVCNGIPVYAVTSTDPDSPTGLTYRITVLRDGQEIGRYDGTTDASAWDSATYGSGATARCRPTGIVLAPGEYSWTARAYDGSHWSADSPAQTFTVIAGAPVNLKWGLTTLGLSASGMAPTLDELGAPGARVRTWNPTTQAWSDVTGALESGKAYFVRWDANTVPLRIAGSVPPTPATVSLVRGWNFVPLPWLSPIDWDASAIRVAANGTVTDLAAAAASGVLEPVAWVWEPADTNPYKGSYVVVADLPSAPGVSRMLMPWVGIWLLAYQPCTLTFPTTAGRADARPNARDAWVLCLRADTDADGTSVVIGGASAALSASPAPRSPDSERAPTLTVVGAGAALGVDVRALPASRAVWTLNLSVPASDSARTVTVSWRGAATLPRGVDPILVDEQSGRSLALRAASSFTVVAPPSGGTYRYRIELASPLAAPRLTSLKVAASRAASGCTLTYCLNTSASVSVRVMAGSRVVRNFPAVRRSPGAGQLMWDGRDQSGVSLPAGTYLLEVSARSDDGRVSRAAVPVVLVR